MNNARTPLVNKLILLVLVGICLCLVVLIAQNKRRNLPEQGPSPATMAQDDATEANRWDAEPSVRLRVTNNLPRSELTAVASIPDQEMSPTTPVLTGIPTAKTMSGSIPSTPAVETPFVTGTGIPSGERIGRSFYAPGVPISGRVVLSGTPPPEIPITMDPICAALHAKQYETSPTTRHYVVGEQGGLANVWVYVVDLGGGPFVASTQQLVLNQIGCLYEPYVFGVMVKQPVLIRNSDPMLHNVNTTASSKQANRFNIAQPRQGKEDVKAFSEPDALVKFRCNIHPWMLAYGRVFAHPFFAVTDSEGRFELPAGLPPGEYRLTALHLKAGLTSRQIRLQEGAPATPLEIVLNVPSR